MIKEIREQLDMSQGELGEQVGKSQGAISHYEIGRRPIDVDFAKSLIRLCKSRGLDVDYNKIFDYESTKAANG